jgi:hypothetical protein
VLFKLFLTYGSFMSGMPICSVTLLNKKTGLHNE